MLITLAFQFLTIPHTLSRRRKLIVVEQVFTVLQASCGRRRMLAAMQCFTILQTSNGPRGLLTALQLFTILHKSLERRRLNQGTQLFTTADIGAIRPIHHMIFVGIRIGEAAHPGDFGDEDLVQRMRA